MKFRVLLSLLALLFLLPHAANALGGLGISIPDVFTTEGSMFSISATIFNSRDSSGPITVNNAILTSSSPLLDNYDVGFGADYSKLLGDPFTGEGHTYAPGDTVTGAQFLTFTPNPGVAPGVYTVNVEIDDTSGAAAAQTSFNVHIQAVPEFGTTLSVAGLLGAGGYGLWRQRRQRRPNAAVQGETPRLEP